MMLKLNISKKRIIISIIEVYYLAPLKGGTNIFNYPNYQMHYKQGYI